MSALHVLGVNHHQSPLSLRERLVFAPAELPAAVESLLREQPLVAEAAVLSTCARTEIYCSLPDARPTPAREQPAPVREWLAEHRNMEQAQLQPHLYAHRDAHAVRHLMRVAGGLDSIVPGEAQVLGQVKEAYRAAREAGGLGPLLGPLFENSFSTAKQIRTRTGIGTGSVSMAAFTVRLAHRVFGSLEQCQALLIGAGEVIGLVACRLRDHRLGQLVIANRDLERAWHLARRCGGSAVPLAEAQRRLARADLVISATAAAKQLLTRADFERALAGTRRRPVFVADLGVPRNLDPAIGLLQDVYFYTVDDLQELCERHLALRLDSARDAEGIIERRVADFMAWLQGRRVTEQLRRLRKQGLAAQERVLDDALRRLKRGEDPERVLRGATDLLARKLLHGPSVRLRKAAAQGRSDWCRLLGELHDPERSDGHPAR